MRPDTDTLFLSSSFIPSLPNASTEPSSAGGQHAVANQAVIEPFSQRELTILPPFLSSPHLQSTSLPRSVCSPWALLRKRASGPSRAAAASMRAP